MSNREPTIVFIYTKEGKIKVLGLNDAKGCVADELIQSGWVHIHTINTCVWIEHLHNLSNRDRIIEVDSLSLPF